MHKLALISLLLPSVALSQPGAPPPPPPGGGYYAPPPAPVGLQRSGFVFGFSLGGGTFNCGECRDDKREQRAEASLRVEAHANSLGSLKGKQGETTEKVPCATSPHTVLCLILPPIGRIEVAFFELGERPIFQTAQESVQNGIAGTTRSMRTEIESSIFP
jgi:hypothetical protein